jgi:hypothetical protein
VDYGVVISDERGSISLESGDSPRLLKGIDALFQQVVIELLSSPTGYGEGSGLAEAIQTTLTGNPNAAAIFGQRVKLAEEHIQAFQQDISLSLDEQLDSLELSSVVAGDINWELEIMLTNRTGETIRRFFDITV